MAEHSTEEAVDQEISLLGRMIGVFTGPGETFESVQRKHSTSDWIVPVLMVSLVVVGATYFSLPYIEQMQKAAIEASMEQNPDVSAEQRQAIDNIGGITRTISLVVAPVMIFITLFIFSLFFMLVGRFALGAEVSYGLGLAVCGLVYLVSIPQQILLALLRSAKGEMVMAIGPGVLLSGEMASSFIGRMANVADIFQLWQICLLAIALGVIGRTSMQKPLLIYIGLWLVWLAFMTLVTPAPGA